MELTPEEELELLAEGQTPELGDSDKFTAFAPGMPEDPDAIPSVHYQALLGRVYVLTRWKDGSTVRGEIPLAELEARVGGPVREGWYDVFGEYVGQTLELEE